MNAEKETIKTAKAAQDFNLKALEKLLKALKEMKQKYGGGTSSLSKRTGWYQDAIKEQIQGDGAFKLINYVRTDKEGRMTIKPVTLSQYLKDMSSPKKYSQVIERVAATLYPEDSDDALRKEAIKKVKDAATKQYNKEFLSKPCKEDRRGFVEWCARTMMPGGGGLVRGGMVGGRSNLSASDVSMGIKSRDEGDGDEDDDRDDSEQKLEAADNRIDMLSDLEATWIRRGKELLEENNDTLRRELMTEVFEATGKKVPWVGEPQDKVEALKLILSKAISAARESKENMAKRVEFQKQQQAQLTLMRESAQKDYAELLTHQPPKWQELKDTFGSLGVDDFPSICPSGVPLFDDKLSRTCEPFAQIQAVLKTYKTARENFLKAVDEIDEEVSSVPGDAGRVKDACDRLRKATAQELGILPEQINLAVETMSQPFAVLLGARAMRSRVSELVEKAKAKLEDGAGAAACGLLLEASRDVLEKELPAGVKWEAVEKAASLIDSPAKMKSVLANPKSFVKTLVVEVGGPAVKELLKAQAEASLEEVMRDAGVEWASFKADVLDLIDDAEDLRAAVTDPKGLLAKLEGAATGAAEAASRTMILLRVLPKVTDGVSGLTTRRPGPARGLKWREAAPATLKDGRALNSDKLADALKSKREFTQKEWGEFDIEDLRFKDFIQVKVKRGDKYYEPADPVPSDVERVLQLVPISELGASVGHPDGLVKKLVEGEVSDALGPAACLAALLRCRETVSSSLKDKAGGAAALEKGFEGVYSKAVLNSLRGALNEPAGLVKWLEGDEEPTDEEQLRAARRFAAFKVEKVIMMEVAYLELGIEWADLLRVFEVRELSEMRKLTDKEAVNAELGRIQRNEIENAKREVLIATSKKSVMNTSLVKQSGVQWEEIVPLLLASTMPIVEQANKQANTYINSYLAKKDESRVGVKLLLPKLKVKVLQTLPFARGLPWRYVEAVVMEVADAKTIRAALETEADLGSLCDLVKDKLGGAVKAAEQRAETISSVVDAGVKGARKAEKATDALSTAFAVDAVVKDLSEQVTTGLGGGTEKASQLANETFELLKEKAVHAIADAFYSDSVLIEVGTPSEEKKGKNKEAAKSRFAEEAKGASKDDPASADLVGQYSFHDISKAPKLLTALVAFAIFKDSLKYSPAGSAPEELMKEALDKMGSVESECVTMLSTGKLNEWLESLDFGGLKMLDKNGFSLARTNLLMPFSQDLDLGSSIVKMLTPMSMPVPFKNVGINLQARAHVNLHPLTFSQSVSSPTLPTFR